MRKPPPSGKLARGAVGSLALAQAGVARLGHKARQLTRSDSEREAAQDRHDADVGRILFQALNQLKGSALKVAQLLSLEATILPEAMRRELAKACHQVTPLNQAQVHKVFRHEFGQAPGQLFARFEAQAFAAASLGQVHRAELADGRALAVKVQYPGIAAAIASDMRMLRALVGTLGGYSEQMPHPAILARFMDQAEHTLAEEVDYLREAEQLRWFHQHALPGLVVPLPLASHSSRRVLTMERLDGLHLDAWLATAPPQQERDRCGQLLYDWFWHSLFVLGRINADPHPGNIVFMADGRLGLLDFGCTRDVTPAFCAALARCWSALLAGALGEARLACVELGVIAPTLSADDFAHVLMPALAPMHDWQLQPLRTPHFDFATKTPFPPSASPHAATMARCLVSLPDELPYFDRAYLGLMHMLKQIGARVATANRWITPTSRS